MSESVWQTGRRLRDTDNDDPDAEVWVVEYLTKDIDQHVVFETDQGSTETVFDYHRGDYPRGDDVVRCVYAESVLDAFPMLSEDSLTVDALVETLRDLDVEDVRTEHGYVTIYAFPASRLVEWDGGDGDA